MILKKSYIICRFGKGYTLTIRCVPNFSEVLLKRISNDLPTATVEDQHCSQLKFNIPQESAHLNEIFSTLSGYKNESIIEDYSVSQTTLDDVSYTILLLLRFIRILTFTRVTVCIFYILDICQICK